MEKIPEEEELVRRVYEELKENRMGREVPVIRDCPNCGERRALFKRGKKSAGVCAECLMAELKNEWRDFGLQYGKPANGK